MEARSQQVFKLARIARPSWRCSLSPQPAPHHRRMAAAESLALAHPFAVRRSAFLPLAQAALKYWEQVEHPCTMTLVAVQKKLEQDRKFALAQPTEPLPGPAQHPLPDLSYPNHSSLLPVTSLPQLGYNNKDNNKDDNRLMGSMNGPNQAALKSSAMPLDTRLQQHLFKAVAELTSQMEKQRLVEDGERLSRSIADQEARFQNVARIAQAFLTLPFLTLATSQHLLTGEVAATESLALGHSFGTGSRWSTTAP